MLVSVSELYHMQKAGEILKGICCQVPGDIALNLKSNVLNACVEVASVVFGVNGLCDYV